MALSDVDIANRALTLLGEPPITSLTGSNKAQVLCSQNYESARDEVISSHPWAAAVKRAALVQYADPTNYTMYSYVYAYPSDCLRMIRIIPEVDTDTYDRYVMYLRTHLDEVNDIEEDAYGFVIEGNDIYTNAPNAIAVYIRQVTDPNDFAPYLVEAISANLARKIAYSLTQSSALLKAAKESYFTAYALAMRHDSMQRTHRPNPPTQWEDLH